MKNLLRGALCSLLFLSGILSSGISRKAEAQTNTTPDAHVAGLASALAGLTPTAGDCGLLLGFDTDTSDYRDGYGVFYGYEKPDRKPTIFNRTLYLTRTGDSVRLIANLNYLASPQRTGFIYLGSVRTRAPARGGRDAVFDDGYAPLGFDYINVWQANSKAEIPAAQRRAIARSRQKMRADFKANGDNIVDYATVSYVGDGFYFTSGFWAQITGGATFFNAYSRKNTTFLSGKKFGLKLRDHVSQAQIETAFRQSFDSNYGTDKDMTPAEKENFWESILYGLRGEEELTGAMRDSADGNSEAIRLPGFTLERSTGHTRLIGLMMTDGNQHRSFHNTAEMGAVPASFVRYDNPPELDFAKIKVLYPAAIDVFVAPNQSTVYVLTDAEIIGIDVATQREIYRQPHKLKFNKTVMVEWATGANVARWTSVLTN